MANQYLANTQPYATPTGQPRTGKTQGQPKGLYHETRNGSNCGFPDRIHGIRGT